MLVKWLGSSNMSVDNNLPQYSHHCIGVGGLGNLIKTRLGRNRELLNNNNNNNNNDNNLYY